MFSSYLLTPENTWSIFRTRSNICQVIKKERKNERKNEQTKERKKERTNERKNERKKNERKKEQKKEWKEERTNERRNEKRTKERTKERKSEKKNEKRTKERTRKKRKKERNEILQSELPEFFRSKVAPKRQPYLLLPTPSLITAPKTLHWMSNYYSTNLWINCVCKAAVLQSNLFTSCSHSSSSTQLCMSAMFPSSFNCGQQVFSLWINGVYQFEPFTYIS